ncbi:MAG: DUF4369 domain-containing protein [Mediterranea sp.]|jgi:cell fate (sporulation/competence/biofilm development) regulator YlbF (YheA/YmcA/DUF963 family)|nr:DUF4369 domain-containing protein [Mediterranea sp.]
MSKIRIFGLFTVLVALTSCGNSYKINGTSSITGLDGKMLTLRTLREGNWQTVDSAEVVHGYFTMKGKPDSVMMVALFMDNDNLMPLVLERGKIKVTIGNTQLKATGTPLNDALYEFIEHRNKLELLLDEIERKEARMIMEGTDYEGIHEQIAHESDSLILQMNKYVRDFITTNYDNVLGPGMFMLMCSTLPYPLLTPQLEDIIKGAPQSFRSNIMVKEWLGKAKENKKLLDEQKQRQEENLRLQENLTAGGSTKPVPDHRF